MFYLHNGGGAVLRFIIVIRIYHECEGRPENRRLASRGLPSDDKR